MCLHTSGFRMSCIRDEVLNEAAVDLVDRFSVISSSDTFKVICYACLLRTGLLTILSISFKEI